MIEKKYTGIAKQGADVVANPTLDGSEQALNSIQINGENFKIEVGGISVVTEEFEITEDKIGENNRFEIELKGTANPEFQIKIEISSTDNRHHTMLFVKQDIVKFYFAVDDDFENIENITYDLDSFFIEYELGGVKYLSPNYILGRVGDYFEIGDKLKITYYDTGICDMIIL